MHDMVAPEKNSRPNAQNIRIEGVGDFCGQAYREADKICNARDVTMVISMIAPQLLAGMTSGDSMEKSCKTARNLTVAGVGAFAYFESQCRSKRSACLAATACAAVNPTTGYLLHPREYNECQGFQRNMMIMMAAGARYLQSITQSQACLDAIARFPCQDPAKARTNPDCPAFCAQPTNRSHPSCQVVAMCDQEQYKNMSTCICMRNPQDPNCPSSSFANNPSFGGVDPGGGGELPTLPTGNENSLIPDISEEDPGYQGNPEAKSNPAKTAFDDRGGGGGGLQGLGNNGGPPPGGGAGAPAAGPFNTNIMSEGRGGGGGGYPFFRGANEPEEKQGGGRGFGGPGLPPEMRSPAQVAQARQAMLFDQGITGANGLSNFEKVTRKMNEKRPKLLPP